MLENLRNSKDPFDILEVNHSACTFSQFLREFDSEFPTGFANSKTLVVVVLSNLRTLLFIYFCGISSFAFILILLPHSNSGFLWLIEDKQMSGPQCCSNPPTLNPSSGSGHVEKFGGLDTYVTGSPDSKRAILLVSDIFGTCPPVISKIYLFFICFSILHLFLHYMIRVHMPRCVFERSVGVFGLLGIRFSVLYVNGSSESV